MNKETEHTVVHEGKYIRFLKVGEWEYVERHNCTGIVIILALTRENKIILSDQFRIPVGKRVIEFPAGLVNDLNGKRTESFLNAAKRELFEETGYRAKRMVKVVEGPVASGSTSDCVTFVRAFGLSKKGKGGGVEDESIITHEVPLLTVDGWLKQMGRKGFLVDPKVYAGLYFLNGT